MKDQFNREIRYMRISVTDRCNFRCKYCMPAEGICDIGHDSVLTFEEITRVVRAAAELGITKYRITGGEPLARKGIVGLVASLASIPGVEELAMTTNGSLLSSQAKALKDAGLNRVNVSLDTLDEEKFKEITRGGELSAVFEGINTAAAVGLTPVKLNTVIMKGFNDDEIMDFVQLTIMHELDVRFIELMPVGGEMKNFEYGFLSCDEIKSKLPALRKLDGGQGVAELYKYPMGRGKIGFISAISDCFCESCDKIRMTADGKVKTCLHSGQEFDLKPALLVNDSEQLKEQIKAAIFQKEKKHQIAEGAATNLRSMNKIGG